MRVLASQSFNSVQSVVDWSVHRKLNQRLEETSLSTSDALDAKERVRQETDIVELIGGEIPLRRQGRNFVGPCIWHEDRRPSLQVNPERQTWKCWVCDIGGDVFSFVMHRENVEFGEALKMLADRAKIDLAPQTGQRRTKRGDANHKQTLYDACKWAVDQYHQCLLRSPEAEMARQYLAERNINQASIERYKIGFSPPAWQWILDRSSSFSPAVLESLGLVKKSAKGGRLYDFFRGRVLFPIVDTQKRAIGVGGRILPSLQDDKSAKYVNCPETLLYSKSEQLYGLNLARDVQSVRKEKEIIVMEGYTDVVVSSQFGVDNVVAVCGTALTERHVRLLKRYATKIVLVLDGDAAGKTKATSILELFVASPVDLRIVTLPEGFDPCDFMLKNGAVAFRQLVIESPDALEHKIQASTTGLDPVRETHRANLALQDLLSTIAKAPRLQDGGSMEQRLREQQIVNKLSRYFQIGEAEIRTQLTEIRRNSRTKKPHFSSEPETVPRAKPQLSSIERDLFELLIRRPEYVPTILEHVSVDSLQTETAKQLLEKYAILEAEAKDVDFGRFMLEFDDEQIKNLLVDLDEKAQRKKTFDSQVILADVLAWFDRKENELELRAQQASLESGQVDEDEQVKMLEQLINRRKEMN